MAHVNKKSTIKLFFVLPAVLLWPIFSQTTLDLHPATVPEKEVHPLLRKLRPEVKSTSNPAGQKRVFPSTEQLATGLQKHGPLPASNQENAFLAAYPIYYDSLYRQHHKTGAGYPGFIYLTNAADKAGLPAENKEIPIINSLFIFLTTSAILLFTSPLILPAVKRYIFADSDKKRNGGDNLQEDVISDLLFSVAGEKAKQVTYTSGIQESTTRAGNENPDYRKSIEKTGRITEGRSKQTGKLKNFSALRYMASDRSSAPNSRIADKFNPKSSNTANTLQRLAAVHKIALATSSAMELNEIFHNLLDITINTLSSEIGYILQYDHEKEIFRVRSFLSCYGMSPKHGEIPFAPQNVSTFVYKTRKPLLIRDINETPQFGRLSVFGYERRSLICVPLIVQNEIIGTMAVVNKINNSVYNSEDMKFLSTIASQASLAIKNAKLHEEQKKAYMNIVHALVSIIEASDSYTKGHSDRVTFYSVELARKINLPRNRIDIVERAAILHDIGKIGINVYLLNKEMQLSPEEIDKLRQHPLIGMKILEPLEFLRDVSTCIGQHHERVDGTGYPYGIPGSKLLLESQILAIADAYDAMTSDRPYRLALSRAEAVKELKDNAGKQHDHDLVRHFVELLESGRLDIITSKPDIIPSLFMGFDPASEFFTDFSARPLMSGLVESP